MYRAADVCVVSSLHDGMNLVAKEFIAARSDEHGVLVLSEFTGAARELDHAVHVNPFAVDAFADALHTALLMSPARQRAAHARAARAGRLAHRVRLGRPHPLRRVQSRRRTGRSWLVEPATTTDQQGGL